MNDKITLYLSNWLYNAGVIGFLKLIYHHEKYKFEFNRDGSVSLDKDLFVRNKEKLSTATKLLVDYITKDENIDDWLKETNKSGLSNI